jgi:hypothetical protein
MDAEAGRWWWWWWWWWFDERERSMETANAYIIKRDPENGLQVST